MFSNRICRECWSACDPSCPRCHGSGEEPQFRWGAYLSCVAILIIFLYAVWSIPK